MDENFSKRILTFIFSHKICVALILIAVFSLPLVIVHFVFKFNCHPLLHATWTSGDVLGYFGEMIGAAATIFAIIITIQLAEEGRQEDHKRQKCERKLSVKPYLQTFFSPIFSKNDVDKYFDEIVYYVIYPENSKSEKEVFPSVSLEIPGIFRVSEKNASEHRIDTKLRFFNDYYVFFYSIENIGAGNAINIQFYLNEIPFIPFFSLAINGQRDFIFVFPKNVIENDEFLVSFRFEYSDVASISCYAQNEVIRLLCNEEGKPNFRRMLCDLISPPQEIECDLSTVRFIEKTKK